MELGIPSLQNKKLLFKLSCHFKFYLLADNSAFSSSFSAASRWSSMENCINHNVTKKIINSSLKFDKILSLNIALNFICTKKCTMNKLILKFNKNKYQNAYF